jgi:hypothetical protein
LATLRVVDWCSGSRRKRPSSRRRASANSGQGRSGRRKLYATYQLSPPSDEPRSPSNRLILACSGIAVSSSPRQPSAVSSFWFKRLTSTAIQPLIRKSGDTLPSGS